MATSSRTRYSFNVYVHNLFLSVRGFSTTLYVLFHMLFISINVFLRLPREFFFVKLQSTAHMTTKHFQIIYLKLSISNICIHFCKTHSLMQ